MKLVDVFEVLLTAQERNDVAEFLKILGLGLVNNKYLSTEITLGHLNWVWRF